MSNAPAWRTVAIPVFTLLMTSYDATAQPDLLVSDITTIQRLGEVDDRVAFSASVTSCNLGTLDVPWSATTNQHPVFTQNLYRLKDGIFEQIGQSWVFHGFCALGLNLCDSCTAPPTVGCWLAPGCATTNSAALMGSQQILGRRSEINACNGSFDIPFDIDGDTSSIGKRLQMREVDINPALNPNARYFLEIQALSSSEQGDDVMNNVSWHEITPIAGLVTSLSLTQGATTQIGETALSAWLSDPRTTVHEVDVPNDGSFVVAVHVQELPDDHWRYQYVVRNTTSCRAAGALTIPVGESFVSDPIFRDIDPHSGEVYDGTDWVFSSASGSVTFASTETFDQNPDANALRWGTAYTFAFVSDAPPVNGTLELGLFEPGPATSVTFTARAPATGGTVGDCVCEVDGDPEVIDIRDVLFFLVGWFDGDVSADVTMDGVVNIVDLLAFLDCWLAQDSDC